MIVLIEPRGFTDNDRVKQDLKNLLSAEPYFKTIRFIHPTAISHVEYLANDIAAPYLHISVSLDWLFASPDRIAIFDIIGGSFEYFVELGLRVEKGQAIEDVYMECAKLSEDFMDQLDGIMSSP